MRSEQNFIGGRFVDADGDDLLTVINPATGQNVATLPATSVAQATAAVDAAAAAQRHWRALTAIERGDHLLRLADALDAHAERIGTALAAESGKSLDDACSEARYAAQITRYHAGWARRIEGEVIQSDTAQETLLLQREPIGVVACLIPFNFPVYTLLRKIAPALITGNTVVVRPSNNTPLSALQVARAVASAGLPDGVVNIMAMQHHVAQALCTHPAVGMITLTGSVGVGRQVLEYCKANIAKPSLELGGKTPAIVCADTDLAHAASAIVASRTTHCGQLCTAVERVYVQDSVYAPFLALLKERMAAVTIADRAVDPLAMGPLATARARDEVHAKVQRAIAAGATLETGGVMPDRPGFFYPATLLSACSQDMEIVQEEVFGPVLPVLRFSDLDEAIALANDHQFGLSSVLFTEDYRGALQAAHRIEAGELYINRTPADPYQGFHAGWKRSGLGGDDGKHGMLEFTQTRLVVMKY